MKVYKVKYNGFFNLKNSEFNENSVIEEFLAIVFDVVIANDKALNINCDFKNYTR